MKNVTGQDLHADRLLTSHEVGDLLQVNPSSVKKWVNEGRIAAFRTPGGHRRIRVSDLVDFLQRHAMPIPRPLAGVAKKRLLIVDDDVMQLRALERRLRPHHARVHVVLTENGIDALLMVGTFKPDLIVLDVYMPELDGVEVCRRLKHNAETRHIEVIVTSAHMSPAVEEKARAAGARLCLPKPVESRVLLELLGLSEQLGG